MSIALLGGGFGEGFPAVQAAKAFELSTVGFPDKVAKPDTVGAQILTNGAASLHTQYKAETTPTPGAYLGASTFRWASF